MDIQGNINPTMGDIVNSMHRHLFMPPPNDDDSTALELTSACSSARDGPTALEVMDADETSEYEIEYEVSTPRLCTPFYEALRKRYPRAFKRRAHISSQFSDTASMASLSSELSLGVTSVRSCSTTPRSKRPRALHRHNTDDLSAHHHGGGLPPRPPSHPRKKSDSDMGVVGSPRKLKYTRSRQLSVGDNSPPNGSRDTLLSSDLRGSTDSLDNLDDRQDSGADSNLQKRDFMGSLSSLASEHVTPTWRKNVRLVKRPHYSSTHSLKGSQFGEAVGTSPALADAADVGHMHDSMQNLRERLNDNRDSLRRLLHRDTQQLFIASGRQRRQSSDDASSRDVKSKNRRHMTHAAHKEEVTSKKSNKDSVELLKQLQDRLRASNSDLSKIGQDKSFDLTQEENDERGKRDKGIKKGASVNSVHSVNGRESQLTVGDNTGISKSNVSHDGKNLNGDVRDVSGSDQNVNHSKKNVNHSKQNVNPSKQNVNHKRETKGVGNRDEEVIMGKRRGEDIAVTFYPSRTRLQSPDSARDSAVEVDCASAHSSPAVSENSSSYHGNQISSGHDSYRNGTAQERSGGNGAKNEHNRSRYTRHIQSESTKIESSHGTPEDSTQIHKLVSHFRCATKSNSQSKLDPLDDLDNQGHESRLSADKHASLPDHLANQVSNSATGKDGADQNFVSQAFLQLDKDGERKMESAVVNTEREVQDSEQVFSNNPDKDSDADSGISGRFVVQNVADSGTEQRHVTQTSATSTEEEKSVHMPETALPAANSRLHKLRSRKKSQQAAPSNQSTPVRADHSLQALVSPRGDSSETESIASSSSWARPALKDALGARSGTRPRSASADSRTPRTKRERVIFEDEVGGSIVKPMARAGSQPALNTASDKAPDSDRLLSNGHRNFHSDQDLSHSKAVDEIFPPQTDIRNDSRKTQDMVRSESDAGGGKNVHRSGSPSAEILAKALGQNQASTNPPTALPPKPSLDPSRSSRAKSRQPAKVTNQKSVDSSHDAELANEVALYSSMMEGEQVKEKKSKLPWKRTKGRYTPSEEIEKVQQNVVQSLSRTSSWSSIYSASHKLQDLDIYDHSIGQNTQSNSLSESSNENFASNQFKNQQDTPTEAPANCNDAHKQSSNQNEADITSPTRPPRPNKTLKKQRSSSSSVLATSDYAEIEIFEEEGGGVQEGGQPDQGEDKAEAVYAEVKKTRRVRNQTPTPATQHGEEENEEIYVRPPLPYRGYDDGPGLAGKRELSGSRGSLMGSLRDSARRKFGKLRKALSMEKLSKDEENDTAAKSSKEGAKVRKTPSLRALFGKKESAGSYEISSPMSSQVELPKNFRQLGQVKAINADGTHVVELRKPPHGPYGFYIARGNAKYHHGIFVSRLSDGVPEHFFSGLLSVGDEIKTINNTSLASLLLEQIYELMSESDKLELVVLPYLSRKDQ